MKRYMILICLFVFLTSGCQSSEKKESVSGETSLSEESSSSDDIFMTEGYLPDYDAQNQFSCHKEAALVGDTVYFKCGSSMYFYDMGTGIAAPLCGKAECTHTSGSCNALMWDLCNFCYYDGKLYWVEMEADHYVLMAMGIDGSEHERVQEMPEPFIFNDILSIIRIHRGYVYMAEVLNEVKDGQSYNHLVVVRVKLGEEESEPEIIIDQMGERHIGYNFHMNFWGNKMYFLERDYDTKAEEENITILLYTYNIHTGEMERLSEEKYTNQEATDFLITENGIYMGMYFYEESSEDNYTKIILQYDPEQKKWIELAEIPPLEVGSPFLLDNGKVAASKGLNAPQSVIADYDGNILRVCDFPLSETETEDNIFPYPLVATDEYVIFNLTARRATRSVVLVPVDPEKEIQTLYP